MIVRSSVPTWIRSVSGSAKAANAGEHIPRLVRRVVNVSAKVVIDALGFRLVGHMARDRRQSGQAVRLSQNRRSAPPRRVQGWNEVVPVAIPAASLCRHHTPITSSTTLSARRPMSPVRGRLQVHADVLERAGPTGHGSVLGMDVWKTVYATERRHGGQEAWPS